MLVERESTLKKPEIPDYCRGPVGTAPSRTLCVITMLHICSVHGMDIAMTHCSGLPELWVSPGTLSYLTGHSPSWGELFNNNGCRVSARYMFRHSHTIIIDLSYRGNLQSHQTLVYHTPTYCLRIKEMTHLHLNRRP